MSRQSSGAGSGNTNRARGDSQEITYVPTSVLKGHHHGMELRRNPNGQEVSVSNQLGKLELSALRVSESTYPQCLLTLSGL